MTDITRQIIIIVFWVSLGATVYTYFLYPLFLLVVSRFVHGPRNEKTDQPVQDSELLRVTMIVSAYNEIAILGRKIANCRAIDYPQDKISVSGIELIESYTKTSNPNILTKCGYDFIPYITNFYPEDINKLTFYSEVYNTEKVFGENQKFIISYFIQSFETSKKLPDYLKIKRENTKLVNIIFNEFDISRLPSGNYQLVIEVRDKENNIVAFNKLFFQRSNPNIQFDVSDITALSVENSFASKITSKDTLKEYIRSLSPISSQIERTFAFKQLMSSDLQTMQQYFLNFWLSRDNTNPEQAWLNYLVEVNKVNAAYKTPIKKGYDICLFFLTFFLAMKL